MYVGRYCHPPSGVPGAKRLNNFKKDPCLNIDRSFSKLFSSPSQTSKANQECKTCSDKQ